MAGLVIPLSPPRGRSHAHGTAGERADNWPHTTRVLPWLVAGFLAMLWLLPFDGIDLGVRLPFDSKLDRAYLAVMLLVWLCSLASARSAAPVLRRSLINRALFVFVGVAIASVLMNIGQIELLGEGDLARKKLALLFSSALFFLIVASVIRRDELANFMTLFVALATVAALGTIWEYRTGFNAFYEWADAILPSFFQVAPDRLDPEFERATVTGPTFHGLAIVTMLGIALPFAVAAGLSAKDRGRRLLFFLATAIILVGAVATIRKSAAVVPLAALVTVIAVRPRQMARLWPLGLVLLVLVQALAPGAAGQLKSQLSSADTRQSTLGRTSDYEAVGPDLRAHPLLGRGYGTYDHEKYRILDNEYLNLLITSGLVGLASYIALLLAVLFVALPVIRSGDPVRGPPAVGAAGAAVGFAAATALFDVLAFPHAPYVFFFVAALAAVACSRPAHERGAVPATERFAPERGPRSLGPQPAS